MAVPKQRKTKSRRDQRRRNIFIKSPILTLCKKCNQAILPYNACLNCGYYKGVEAIDVLKKLTKKEKKQKERDMKTEEMAKKKEMKKQGGMSLEELSRKT